MSPNEPNNDQQPDQRWEKNSVPVTKSPSHKKRNIIIGVSALAGVCLLLLLAFLIAPRFTGGPEAIDKDYHSGDENVIVLPVEGPIEAEGILYNQEHMDYEIKSAMHDLDNKAILLKINSPGGTIYESDATYYALENYKEKTGRPVFAYCENLAASGGYYIASAADEIYANRNSLVGSIGVIGGQVINAQEFLNKIGIKLDTVYSGNNKLMGSPDQPLTAEQRQILQNMSDEAYAQFTGIVAKSRGYSPEAVKKLADGRIYTAQQAVNNGLIDGMVMPDKMESIIKADERVGEDVTFIERPYQMPTTFGQSLLGIRYQGPTSPAGEALAFLDKMEEQNQLGPQYLYVGN